MDKTVDIIIPTYRPDDRFKQLILRLKQQEYPVQRICVVNTRSDDFPEAFCREQGIEVSHIEKNEFDHGGTRDMAICKSDAEIVVFMTQDAVPANRRLIGNLVKAFSEPEIAAVYARQLPRKDCSVIEKYIRRFNYPEEASVRSMDDMEEKGIKTFFCSNVCAAYRKEIYDSMGGFEEHTIFNEDMILAGKMILNGYKMAYAAKALVYHSHNYSGIQQFHRNFDLAVSQAEHPEVFAGVKSESEGIRLVKQTMRYLVKIRKLHLIPVLIYQSGLKYIGYRLGKAYRRLPRWIILKCTMNRAYWKKELER